MVDLGRPHVPDQPVHGADHQPLLLAVVTTVFATGAALAGAQLRRRPDWSFLAVVVSFAVGAEFVATWSFADMSAGDVIHFEPRTSFTSSRGPVRSSRLAPGRCSPH